MVEPPDSFPTRYVVYTFVCPKKHINKREGMVFAKTPKEANETILAQRLECSVCGEALADKSAVEVSENRDMPSIPSELKALKKSDSCSTRPCHRIVLVS